MIPAILPLVCVLALLARAIIYFLAKCDAMKDIEDETDDAVPQVQGAVKASPKGITWVELHSPLYDLVNDPDDDGAEPDDRQQLPDVRHEPDEG